MQLTFVPLLLCLGQLPEHDSVEVAAKAYRQRIKQGTLVIRSEFESSQFGARRVHVRKIWFEPARYRIDVYSTDNQDRVVYCENCEKENHYVYYDSTAINTNSYALVFGLHRKGANRHGQRFKLDPRLIGLVPAPSSSYENYTTGSILARSDREDVSTRATEHNGEKAIVHEFCWSGAPEARLQLTFVKAWGPSLVRLVTTVHAKKWQYELRSEYQQHGVGKLWFPKHVTYQKTEGGRVVEKETLTVEEADFDVTPPAAVFHLAGMDLPANLDAQIIGLDAPGRHIWDGNSIVKNDREAFAQRFPDIPPHTASPLWRNNYVIAAVALFLLGAVLVTMARRRGKREP